MVQPMIRSVNLKIKIDMKALSLFLLALVGFVPAAMAQAAPADQSITNDPAFLFYVAVSFVFLVAILVMVVAVYMLKVINLMTEKEAQEKAERLGIAYTPEPTLWQQLWQQSNDFVPLEKEKDIMMAHDYDGIRELDNHLPPWWTGLFYATIVFSIAYLLFFHVFNTLPLPEQEYENELAIAKQEALKFKAANPAPVIDENNVEATLDAQALADGQTVYLSNCASCHRRDGGGDIGPNLTDDYWLHGGDVKSIFKTVRHGVTGTNMISWEGFISPEKIKNVSSYVLTLKGSNPPNPKKPEGTLFKPEVTAPKDSVAVQATL